MKLPKPMTRDEYLAYVESGQSEKDIRAENEAKQREKEKVCSISRCKHLKVNGTNFCKNHSTEESRWKAYRKGRV